MRQMRTFYQCVGIVQKFFLFLPELHSGSLSKLSCRLLLKGFPGPQHRAILSPVLLFLTLEHSEAVMIPAYFPY